MTKRRPNDYYPTPAEATQGLLAREDFGRVVWEPACGEGAISRLLLKAGYQVQSSDLIDRGYGEVENFLTSHRKVESIITNPPYRYAERFIWKALASTTNKVAMLLRLQFLESEARRQLFHLTPLRTVYVFRRRLRLTNEKSISSAFAHAWYVWEHGYIGKPQLDWM